MRITSDCPFSDPNLIDKLIDILIKKKLDYVSNTMYPTFPDGLDIEVCDDYDEEEEDDCEHHVEVLCDSNFQPAN